MIIRQASFCISMFCLLLAACATTEENKQLAYNHFKIGVTFQAKDQKEQALQQLLLARDLDPDNEMIQNHLGLAYYFLKEYELAVVSFKNALAIKPNFSEAQNNLGRTYVDLNDFQNARLHLTMAANDLTYPHKDKVWVNFGLSYFNQNDFKNSQTYFLKAISANRNNCLAYNYYGRAQIELEKFDKAVKAMDQAIYHCQLKGFDEPYYYGAISYFRLGYKAKAIARLQEGRKLFPDGPNKEKINEMFNLMRITETK